MIPCDGDALLAIQVGDGGIAIQKNTMMLSDPGSDVPATSSDDNVRQSQKRCSGTALNGDDDVFNVTAVD